MFKKILSTLFITLFFTHLCFAMQNEQIISRPQVVIGVDLHDTFLQSHPMHFAQELMKIVAQAPNKGELLALFPKAYSIMKDAKEIGKHPKASGDGGYVMRELVKKYPALNTIMSKILIAAALELHKPNPKMIALIQELKAKGYPTIVVSNISQESFDLVKQKYLEPEGVHLFDGYFISDMVPERIKKPAQDFYIYLRTWLREKGYGDQQMVFFDDRQDFIDGAHAANVGITGILFKNPEQLRADLVNMRILEEKPPEQTVGYWDWITRYVHALFG